MNPSLRKIKRILEDNKFVLFAYLFGSRAAGISHARSDWDIAVYLDKKALKDWSRFWIEAEIERELKEKVQVTVINAVEEPVFAFEVIHQGIVLTDKNPETRILFETSILRRYHDWEYLFKRHVANYIA